jgi:hypothetical protein
MFGVTDADYATLTGCIDISPTLDWGNINVSPYLDADGAIGGGTGHNRSRQLKFSMREELVSCSGPVVERPGQQREEFHIRRWADGLVPVSAGQLHYANNLIEDLQELVEEFPGHEFLGYIQVHPQAPTSLHWRLCVIDGQARKVHPRLLWPDGAKSTLDGLISAELR